MKTITVNTGVSGTLGTNPVPLFRAWVFVMDDREAWEFARSFAAAGRALCGLPIVSFRCEDRGVVDFEWRWDMGWIVYEGMDRNVQDGSVFPPFAMPSAPQREAIVNGRHCPKKDSDTPKERIA